MDESQIFDVAIVGSGPAGLSASVYASRYFLSNLVFGSTMSSEMVLSFDVENYLGYQSIKGADLLGKFREQAESFGADLVSEIVTEIVKPTPKMPHFRIATESGKTFYANGIILSAGAQRKKLNIKGEDEYAGRGVSYCTICDGMFFKNKTVMVLGGGDAAATGALTLSDIAKKTYLNYRKKKEDLKAEPIWIERLSKKVSEGRAEFIFETAPVEILGDGQKVTGVKLSNNQTLLLDGIFVEIGSVPDRKLTQMLGIKTNENGYIEIDSACATNVEGVFAAGNITTGSNGIKQIITAVAEGVIAAASVYQWLKKS